MVAFFCSRDLVAKEKHLIVELCASVGFLGWGVKFGGGFGAGVDCGAGVGAVEGFMIYLWVRLVENFLW